MCGNSTMPSELNILMDGQIADALITDPPYSSGGQYSSDRQKTTNEKYVVTGTQKYRPDFSGDNRDQRSWTYWTMLWLSNAYNMISQTAPFVVFIDWRQLPALTDAVQAAGFIWRGVAVWDKTEGVRPTLGRYRQQAEFMVWGSKGPMPLNPQIGALPGVYRYPVKQNDKFHITGKMTPLIGDLIKIAPTGIILDMFAGSGTTIIAAERAGHTCYAMEMDPGYCNISVERWEKETGHKAEKIK